MCLQDLQDGCFGKIVQEHLARPIICQIEQEDLSSTCKNEQDLCLPRSSKMVLISKDKANPPCILHAF